MATAVTLSSRNPRSKEFHRMTRLQLAPLALAIGAVLMLGACAEQPASPPSPAAADAAAAPRLQIDESVLMQPVSLSLSDIDLSISACQHLGDMVNSRWLAANPMPADQTRWGSFQVLHERSMQMQREIATAAANAEAAPDTITAKVGNFFATGMDEAAVEAAGLSPLQPHLERIDAIDGPEALAAYLREAYARGLGGLFGFFASADIRDSNVNIAYASQGGLSLPERSYYLEEREDILRIRAAFLDHVAKILTLSGVEPAAAAAQAQQILAFETRLAQASMDRVAMRDPANRYNPVDLATADALTPNFSWTAFFDTLQVQPPSMFSLAQTDFFREVDHMMADVSPEQWKTWLRFRMIDSASPYLPEAFATQNYDFYSRTIAGQQAQEERWKRVLNAMNSVMGEAFGQLYVEVAFPPESKEKMERLVANLSEALKVRLQNLDWMGDETKAKALEKWASFTPKIGYPDVWRDWNGLQIGRDSYLANRIAGNAFNTRWMLDKIGQPVDRNEWGMPPQMVNAYYRATANEIVFPAAILQPPFFDPNADDALNYGGIGAVIGHEMLHGYDDQGSKFDAQGNFENWWTDEDRARFNAATDKLVDQFDNYEALPGMFVNGRLALGENIADLGGLTVAFDAMKRAQQPGFEDVKVDGYTQEQRFFMNWATVWRIGFAEERLKVQLTVGPHAPGQFRAIGAPSNMPAFAEAFGCQDSDPMVRSGEQRVAIW
jgi:putative endopeptidase